MDGRCRQVPEMACVPRSYSFLHVWSVTAHSAPAKQKANTACREETRRGKGWWPCLRSWSFPCPATPSTSKRMMALIIQEGSVQVTRRRHRTTDPSPPKRPGLPQQYEVLWSHPTHSTPSRTQPYQCSCSTLGTPRQAHTG